MKQASSEVQTFAVDESTRPSKPGVPSSSLGGHVSQNGTALHRACFWDFVRAKVDLPAVSDESRARLCDFGGEQ